jgi:tyrosyl-tRNA synthetase
MNGNAFEELTWRGLVFDCVDGIQDILANQRITIYNGFDPTSDSLHIGHLVPLIALARLQRFGHTPIAVAGGGTGMIGDPSGKAAERQLLSIEQIEANVKSIRQQLTRLLDFEVETNCAQVVNNADWLLSLKLIDFLRDTGKHFTINYMVAKESVKARIEREEGISFTEFSYMLLQSYDFLHLHDHTGCILQTGGSDQWGNITAGVELVRRVRGKQVYGLVYPLVTKADGTKFGKTEEGAVWLSPERTSPYRFYQFWLNTDDRDAIPYLKFFTFLSKTEIEALESSLNDHPDQREAQRALGRHMTSLVHGETELDRAEQASKVLFGAEISGLSAREIEDIFGDVPSSEMKKEIASGSKLVDLLFQTGFLKSKGEARRSITEGGIYLNNRRISDLDYQLSMDDVVEGRFIILRKGRKNYHLVKTF